MVASPEVDQPVCLSAEKPLIDKMFVFSQRTLVEVTHSAQEYHKRRRSILNVSFELSVAVRKEVADRIRRRKQKSDRTNILGQLWKELLAFRGPVERLKRTDDGVSALAKGGCAFGRAASIRTKAPPLLLQLLVILLVVF